jgi:Polyketide cyclase / dehydrase and lipid transport
VPRDHSYSFRSVWEVEATPDQAFRALRALEDYPAWWREVRDVTPEGADVYAMRVRSVLPYDLRFSSMRSRDDAAAGLLEAEMVGDLDGFSRWTITASGSGARCVFEEQVQARKALLRRLELVGRPAFRANHALMMRHGRTGLRAYLAGFRRAESG